MYFCLLFHAIVLFSVSTTAHITYNCAHNVQALFPLLCAHLSFSLAFLGQLSTYFVSFVFEAVPCYGQLKSRFHFDAGAKGKGEREGNRGCCCCCFGYDDWGRLALFLALFHAHSSSTASQSSAQPHISNGGGGSEGSSSSNDLEQEEIYSKRRRRG